MNTQICVILVWGTLATAAGLGDDAVSARSYDVTVTSVVFDKEAASWMGCEYPANLGISPVVRYERQVFEKRVQSGRVAQSNLTRVKSEYPNTFRLRFVERFPIDDPIWSVLIDSAREVHTVDKWSKVILAVESPRLSSIETSLLRRRMNRALVGIGEVIFLG